MSNETQSALMSAINLAKQHNIKSASALKRRLAAQGHQAEHINEALLFWVEHESR